VYEPDATKAITAKFKKNLRRVLKAWRTIISNLSKLIGNLKPLLNSLTSWRSIDILLYMNGTSEN
jgi:hypothetical protein